MTALRLDSLAFSAALESIEGRPPRTAAGWTRLAATHLRGAAPPPSDARDRLEVHEAALAARRLVAYAGGDADALRWLDIAGWMRDRYPRGGYRLDRDGRCGAGCEELPRGAGAWVSWRTPPPPRPLVEELTERISCNGGDLAGAFAETERDRQLAEMPDDLWSIPTRACSSDGEEVDVPGGCPVCGVAAR